MHELSVAGGIVAIAEQHARGRRVTRVEVEIGRLRQVVPDALRFGFNLVAEGTAIDGAELALEEIPVRFECRRCAAESEAEGFPFACAACGSLDVEVTDGEQLQVVALVFEDEPVTA
jgi:hydrogenase nickel incorporation protein HypA/HybF